MFAPVRQNQPAFAANEKVCLEPGQRQNGNNVGMINFVTKQFSFQSKAEPDVRFREDESIFEYDFEEEEESTKNLPYEEAVLFHDKTLIGKFHSIFLLSSHPRIHRGLFRSLHGVAQERGRQLSSFPWVIHPYSDFR